MRIQPADIEVKDVSVEGTSASITYRVIYSKVRDGALAKLFEPRADLSNPGPWLQARAIKSGDGWKLEK